MSPRPSVVAPPSSSLGRESLTAASPPLAQPPPSETSPTSVDRIDPGRVRVVDVHLKRSGTVLRRDCYDPDGDPVRLRDVMAMRNDTLYLRTLQWARSDAMDASPTVRWESTGLTPEEVGKIGIYHWPDGTPIRVFVDTADDTNDG